MKSRRIPKPSNENTVPDDNGLVVSDPISCAKCHGAGECCKNRPLYVEPGDVHRIIRNENARNIFGIKSTSDLYPVGDPEAIKPLVYGVDKEQLLPFCSVRRVELSSLVEALPDGVEPGIRVEPDDQVCPFFSFSDSGVPGCILGDDRLTQCASDPICRSGRSRNRGKLEAWKYMSIDTMCLECDQASDTEEINTTVGDWLMKRGMDERFKESDLFHGLITWCGDRIKGSKQDPGFHWYVLAGIVFDWDRVTGYANENADAMDEISGPVSVSDVFTAARMIMEGVIDGQFQNADIDKDVSR